MPGEVSQATRSCHTLRVLPARRSARDGSSTLESRHEFDDWMYSIDERTMLNRSHTSKVDLELDQVASSFTRK